MNKTLVINAHPNFDSTSSVTLNVLDHFLEVSKQSNPHEMIEQINLYSDEVPAIDQTVLHAWDKLANGEPLTADEQNVTARMTEVLQQFKSANQYVIAMPLYNFNIPSKLKDYMDNVFIAGETFKFTENGSVGLLNDGRSVLVIQGSGSIYTNNDWYTEMEYTHKYLKSIFNFLGVKDYHIIRAQGTALLNRDEILRKAFKEAEEAVTHFFKVSADRA